MQDEKRIRELMQKADGLSGDGSINRVISQWGAPRDGGARRHKGYDLQIEDKTPYGFNVPARVTNVGTGAKRGGNWVELEFDMPDGRKARSRMMHNTQNLVQVGQTINPGQPIATVGRTGNAHGPHIHYEWWENGQVVDPSTVKDLYYPVRLSGQPFSQDRVAELMAKADGLDSPASPADGPLGLNAAVERVARAPQPALQPATQPVLRTPRVTSTVREDVDFDAPIQPTTDGTQPQLYPDATPEPLTLDLGQRIAKYFHDRARPDLPEPPKGYGREQGKGVTVRVRSPKSSYPSVEQIDDAVLEAMGGPAYVEAGRRFKAEAGEPLGQAKFNLAEAFQRGEVGYDDKTGTYVFNVAPNQRFIHALNTYLQTGSVDAVREATRQIDEADEKFERERAEAFKKDRAERGIAAAIGTGVDETAAGAGQLLHNVVMLPKAAGARLGLGQNHPELERLAAEDREAQALVDASQRAIPEETTVANKLARGGAEIAGTIATKGWSGPAFPAVVFAENLHRGPMEATRQAVPTIPMVAAGSAVSRLTNKMSPLARQALTRGASGATNVAQSALAGKTDPTDLVLDAALGAAMPVGRRRPLDGDVRTPLGLERPARPKSAADMPVSEVASEPLARPEGRLLLDYPEIQQVPDKNRMSRRGEIERRPTAESPSALTPKAAALEGLKVAAQSGDREAFLRASREARVADATTEEISSALNEVSAAPPVVEKPLYEMSIPDLEASRQRLESEQRQVAVGLLGREKGNRYLELERKILSPDAPDSVVRRARSEMEQMTRGLTEQQLNRLEQESPVSVDDYKTFRDDLETIAAHSDSEESLARALAKPLTDIGAERDPAKMNRQQQRAYAQMRYAAEIARGKGFDTAKITGMAAERAKGRFSNREDAEFMLRHLFKDTSGLKDAPRGLSAAPATPHYERQNRRARNTATGRKGQFKSGFKEESPAVSGVRSEEAPKGETNEVPVSAVPARPADVGLPRTGTVERAASESKGAARSLPQSLERVGLQKGEDLTYEVVTDKAAYGRAQESIRQQGVDRVAADLLTKLHGGEEVSKDDAVAGFELMRRFEESGETKRAAELANVLSQKLTQAGQVTQAASVLARLSPEGVKIAASRKAGRELTVQESNSVTEAAAKVREAEGKISTLEKQIAELQMRATTRAPRPKLETLQERLQKAESEARARLEARKQGGVKGSQAGASIIPLDIADYAIIGASKLAQKGVSAASFTADMVKEFGEEIRPKMRAIYREAYKLYDQNRKDLLQEQRERSVRRENVGPLRPEDMRRLVNQRLDAQTDARKARQQLAKKFDELSATPGRTFGRKVVDVLGLARAAETALDLSWGLRQGKMALARHPLIWAKGFGKQIQALKADKFERIVSEIEGDADFKYAKRFKLGLTAEGLRGETLGAREESFQTSLADKIPGIAMSQRAQTAMGDVVKFGWFKDYLNKARKAGLDPEKAEDRAVFQQGVDLINDFTGRGKLPRQLEGAAPVLNNTIFSPRFWAARVRSLTITPARMVLPERMGGLSGPARKEAFKTLFAFSSLVAAQLALAKMNGAEVATSPEDKKFGKACWGDTCFDFSAGFQSHIRLALNLEKAIRGESNREPMEIFGTYVRGKESPIASIVHDTFLSRRKEGRGTDVTGEPVYMAGKPGTSGFERLRTSYPFKKLTPMVWNDAIEAYKQSGLGAGLGIGIASFLGEGATSYEQRENRGTSRGTARPSASRPAKPQRSTKE
ncbi:MAG TPA: peptidoglycan DD-metalloendopeptidase family protein [Pyrinomonadaceae bacterium]|nr:peptidoglycan DD-metalloendopeptidase family protein [Pyrinomonadaceae bacterium]